MSDLALKALSFKIDDKAIDRLRINYEEADISNALDLMKKNAQEKGRINAPTLYLERVLKNAANSRPPRKESSMPKTGSNKPGELNISHNEILGQNIETLITEIRNAGEEIVENMKYQAEDCKESFGVKTQFSINIAICGALVFLLAGIYAGVLMSPLITWLTENLNLGYNIIMLSLTTLLPVGIGILIAKLLGFWKN